MTPKTLIENDKCLRRRLHQRVSLKRRRKTWFEKNGPCKQCGTWENLEVDHIDPSTKTTHRVWSWAEKRRNEELAKCQALCKSCHKQKTAEQLRMKQTGRPGRPNKLTEEIVLQIYQLAKNGGSPRAIAREFGVGHSTVSRIRDQEIWGWLTSEKPQLSLFKK